MRVCVFGATRRILSSSSKVVKKLSKSFSETSKVSSAANEPVKTPKSKRLRTAAMATAFNSPPPADSQPGKDTSVVGLQGSERNSDTLFAKSPLIRKKQSKVIGNAPRHCL